MFCDTKSHIVRHCLNSNHETVSIEHFKILNMGYNNNTYRWRISEALFVKQYRSSLNLQDNSAPLSRCKNKEISHSDDGLWKVKDEYIEKGNDNSVVCFPYKNV